VLLADDLLLIQAEAGEVYLVQPDPKKLIELGRIPALTSKTWNNPALAGNKLLVRNDREAVCYELPVRGKAKN
jgi:outer membrane protein assembly factor BamB